jgi:DNA-binding response OmpR family regulator
MRKPISVLHIDDDPVTRLTVHQFLNNHAYHVIEAVNGHIGYNIALMHKPNLILLDFHLPGLDGSRIVERLKSHPTTCSIPIVALTDVSKDEYHRIMIAGCSACLEKPFNTKALLAMVRLFTSPAGKPAAKTMAEMLPR